MHVLNNLKLIFLLVVFLILLVPKSFNLLDKRHIKCSIEEFNSDKYNLVNHLTITGNAQFNYACRYEEYSNRILENVSYFVPIVDSLWTIEKPIKTMLQFQSGKLGFENGFQEAVEKLDKEIDSLSKLKSNRITISGENKLFEFNKLDNQTEEYFKNTYHLKLSSSFKISKIILREHFSKSGFTFVIIFTIVIGFLLYGTVKPMLKKKKL